MARTVLLQNARSRSIDRTSQHCLLSYETSLLSTPWFGRVTAKTAHPDMTHFDRAVAQTNSTASSADLRSSFSHTMGLVAITLREAYVERNYRRQIRRSSPCFVDRH